jgi:arylsulfatase A
MHFRSIATTFACLSACLVSTASSAEDKKPNVILIMADDLGYRDLSSYGHPSIKTPVLDKLAAGGIHLTNFHSGASVCTPSRMALMTGAYPVRCGWTKGVAGYLMGPLDGLSPEALTIAEIFHKEGYATGISGKWHIGRLPGSRPGDQGFDSSYYNPMSNNQLDEIWRGDKIEVKPTDNSLLTEMFTNEAKRFIRENHENPFFLYLPYTAPHIPVLPHPDWKGRSNFGKYGDVVEELDARIGEILGLVDELKLTENTIVVFLSDNGPQKGEKASALPFRGKKWSALEGGTRVPAILSWPGKISAGQSSDRLMGAIDLLPSLCRAAGIDWKAQTKGKTPVDGLDVWDTLIGKESKHPRSELLHWHGMHPEPQALTSGDWKIFFDRNHAIEGLGTEANNKEQTSKSKEMKAEGGTPILFNLKDDLEETEDVSAKFPEQVKILTERAEILMRELDSSEKLEIAKPK